MLDELVGQPELQHRHQHAGGGQAFQHGAARTAHHAAFFDRDQRVVAARQFQHQVVIQRLGKPHVGHRGAQAVSRLERGVQQGAEGQDGDALPLPAHDALAPGPFGQLGLNRDAGTRAARIAHGHRVVLAEGRRQRLAALVFVAGREHAAVGDAAHIGDVVGARVGGAVGTDQPGTVQRKDHRQILDRHVVDQLVVPALQERGVDGHHGLEPFAGHAGGEGDGVLLGNADVVISLGEALVELHHARALAHGRRDADQPLVGLGHVAQPLAEHLRERGLAGCTLGETQRRVELAAGRVVLHRVGFGQLVAVTLLGDDVQELRAAPGSQVFQRGDQRVEVVAIDRADVVEAELLEDGAGHDHALGVLLETPCQLEQRRRGLEHALHALAGAGVEVAAHQARQVLVQRADRWADGHVVVVQHDEQVGADAGVRHA